MRIKKGAKPHIFQTAPMIRMEMANINIGYVRRAKPGFVERETNI